MADQEPESRFGHISMIVLFGGMTTIGVYSSLNVPSTLSFKLGFYPLFFVLFPALTVVWIVAVFRNRSYEKARSTAIWTAVSIVVIVPLFMIILGLLGVGASTILGSAPPWAVVIIILLVLILFRMK